MAIEYAKNQGRRDFMDLIIANFQFDLQMMNDFPHHCIRRCALSLLGRAHSVVNANGGYIED